jgi:hypothetical protein
MLQETCAPAGGVHDSASSTVKYDTRITYERSVAGRNTHTALGGLKDRGAFGVRRRCTDN